MQYKDPVRTLVHLNLVSKCPDEDSHRHASTMPTMAFSHWMRPFAFSLIWETSSHQGNTTLTTVQADADSNAVKPEIPRALVPVFGAFPCGWLFPGPSIGCHQHLHKRICLGTRPDLLLVTTSPLLPEAC